MMTIEELAAKTAEADSAAHAALLDQDKAGSLSLSMYFEGHPGYPGQAALCAQLAAKWWIHFYAANIWKTKLAAAEKAASDSSNKTQTETTDELCELDAA